MAYNQLASSVQKQETEEQFASKLQQIFTIQGGLKDCMVGPVQANDSTATGKLIFTAANRKPLSISTPLIKENGTWRINSPKL